jgi:hypothetical protein
VIRVLRAAPLPAAPGRRRAFRKEIRMVGR